MSFVQAVDGRFYNNPIVEGSDWWLCFSDDPEIMIRKFKRSSTESCKLRASRVLREVGIEFKRLCYYQCSERIFPPSWDTLLEACSYTFELLAPIPLPVRYEAVVNEPGSVWDHSIYGFYSDVSSEDCARAVLGMDIHPLIARALLAKAFYRKEQERIRPEIAKKLYTQVPWLRELTRVGWQEQLKDKPEKVRIQWRL